MKKNTLERKIVRIAKRHGITTVIRDGIFRRVELRVKTGNNTTSIDGINLDFITDKDIANLGLRVTRILRWT